MMNSVLTKAARPDGNSPSCTGSPGAHDHRISRFKRPREQWSGNRKLHLPRHGQLSSAVWVDGFVMLVPCGLPDARIAHGRERPYPARAARPRRPPQQVDEGDRAGSAGLAVSRNRSPVMGWQRPGPTALASGGGAFPPELVLRIARTIGIAPRAGIEGNRADATD